MAEHNDKPTDATGHKMAEEMMDKTTETYAIKKMISLPHHPRLKYHSALDTDTNFVSEVAFRRATAKLCEVLSAEQLAIQETVRHHLNLQGRDDICISPSRDWIIGGFNLCIPIQVPTQGYRLILRCALPNKLAETRYPGTLNEKTACEAAAYVWMQEKCPDISIPRLYGFGFLDHRRYTHQEYRPWYIRLKHRLRRLLFGLAGCLHDFIFAGTIGAGPPALMSRYIYHHDAAATHRLPSAYMLLEDVNATDSQVLDKTWDAQRMDTARQQNLFHGLARIILSLARVPLPYIGAFCFRDDGTITLTNRPLDCTMMIFENDGTPRTMPSNRIYTAVEMYVADLLHLQDQRFLSHPNAIQDEEECRQVMAARVLVRSIAHRYIRAEQRNGPFLLQLTDLRPQNIFVDEDWNIKRIVDLEWVCALPVERLQVPYWLTGQDIGGLEEESLAEYAKVFDAYMVAFRQEESSVAAGHNLSLSKILHESWKSGSSWFWHGLTSINAMEIIFEQHLRPRFFSHILFTKENKVLSSFWSEDTADVVREKVDAYNGYARELKNLFRGS